jgi:hypothetical protein
MMASGTPHFNSSTRLGASRLESRVKRCNLARRLAVWFWPEAMGGRICEQRS